MTLHSVDNVDKYRRRWQGFSDSPNGVWSCSRGCTRVRGARYHRSREVSIRESRGDGGFGGCFDFGAWR